MRRYLVLASVPALVEKLDREGYRTKVQLRASGPNRGGCVFRRGTLYHLLSNRIYCGMIVHKGKAYPGEHEAIVGEGLWEEVQALLKENACGSSRRKRHQHPSLLIGKVFDGEGRAMTPSHAQRGRKRYRYYVTRPNEVDGTRAWRVNAHDLERLVCDHLAERFSDERFMLELANEQLDANKMHCCQQRAEALAARLRSGNVQQKAQLLDWIVARVDLGDEEVAAGHDRTGLASELGLAAGRIRKDSLSLGVPAVRVRRGHQLRLVIPGKGDERTKEPSRDGKLIALVAEAQAARKLVEDHPDRSIACIAEEHGRCRKRLGNLVRLSCLAPDIVTAIVEGKRPATLTAKTLAKTTLPLAWSEQRKVLGFARSIKTN